MALQRAVHALASHGMEQPRLDAETLLTWALKKDRLWLNLNQNEELSPAVLEIFEKAIARRMLCEPVAYITGQKEFWSLEFEVTPDTLIPRPETELMIEAALPILRAVEGPAHPLILDTGTGSGIIAVSLAYELHGIMAIAADISYAALLVAYRNAKRHGVSSRVGFVQADWLTAFKAGRKCDFDMVLANPPYVASSFKESLPRDVVAHEPHIALFGGKDGLRDISRLIIEAASALKTGGCFFCEIGYDQEGAVYKIAKDTNLYEEINILRDIAGNPRLLTARTI